MQDQPLILLTNDDGIASPGLLAAARALAPLGRLMIVAPLRQHSGWGRAMPGPVGEAERVPLDIAGPAEAWSVDTSPAMAVRWALLTRLDATPDLAVSGINYGENIGVSLPISGTVGAACEAASLGAPAVAVSLETDAEHFRSHSDAVDFGMAAAITGRVAKAMLARALPQGVDALNVNVPGDATADTPWRWTQVSREHYFESIVHDVPGGERRIAGWRTVAEPARLEPGSDIRALALDRVVSVSPLTVDTTARDAPDWLDGLGPSAARTAGPRP